MKQITVQIKLPADLHKELKSEAKEQGTYLNTYYEKCLRSGNEEQKKLAKIITLTQAKDK